MPASVGEWRRSGDASAATPVPRGVAAWSAVYDGTPRITATIHEMPSGLAFDVLQKWRPEPGKLAFFRGRYFGVAESAGTDQRALQPFVAAFEKLLPAD